MQTANNQITANLVQTQQNVDIMPTVPLISQLTPLQKSPTLIFTLMTLTNILINLDHGILPACTTQMKKDFNMNQMELGFLGSIVYLGIVLTGTLAGHLYLRFSSKLLTIIALVLLEGSLVLLLVSQPFKLQWLAYISRFLTGSFQVFLLVYYPVWIDKFGLNKKTLWLTILQICVPVGIFTGYGLTAAIINLQSQYFYSFYIQIGVVALFFIGFLFIPQNKLDCRRKRDHHEQTFMDSVPIMRSNLVNSQLVGPNVIEIISQQKRRKNRFKYNYLQMMKKLLKSKIYIVSTLTMAVILFVSTGIQFWLTDYFINVIHVPYNSVYIAYAVISITGPTIGCAFGGIVINKRGGYDNPTTVYVVFIFAAVGIGCAVIIPFVLNFYVICVLLWIVLFFGGAMMPGLTGMMMSSVPAYLRAFGNSNGQIIKNVIGYLPAPFLYGLFNSTFDQSAGIKLIMFWGLFAPFILLLGSVYTYWQLKKKIFGDKVDECQPIPEEAFQSHVQDIKDNQDNPTKQTKNNYHQHVSSSTEQQKYIAADKIDFSPNIVKGNNSNEQTEKKQPEYDSNEKKTENIQDKSVHFVQ